MSSDLFHKKPRYLSETVQDRDIVAMDEDDEKNIISAVSNSAITNDSE